MRRDQSCFGFLSMPEVRFAGFSRRFLDFAKSINDIINTQDDNTLGPAFPRSS